MSSKVILYSTSLRTWGVWDRRRPIAHGSLTACRAAFPEATAYGEDDEEFCPTCRAGVQSSEHHEKCVAPLDQIEGDA